MLDIGLIAAAVIGLGLIAFIAKGLFIVQQSESVVVERLGSYNRTLGPGINFLIPVLERARPIKIRRYESAGIGSKELQERVVEETKIDTRETVLNFPSQPVVTNDNVSIRIDGALYFQIQSPRDAVYEVENLIQAVEVLAKTTLRAVVGERELDTLFSSRDEINNKLQTVMDDAGNKWGVKVNRVEIQDIVLPEEVEDAMRQVMTAERKRRATVTEANGYKEAQVREAEGDRDAAIARAEGERKAIEQLLAAGQETGTELQPQSLISYLIAQEYIKKLPEIAKDGERVLVPYEATGLMGSIESIQGLFTGLGEKAGAPGVVR
ncbi:Regulator of protease activity HflC, stomatin/prohibitin superfamily [Thiohalospira halophila DSM 15071]|uniref:Regulator of protease activity HflC, stomatin/prohibitin superfamily n=1 Tax=Thiohalospira halophila DSM 15071 TaxID=1123397 RepID=A0A1I1QLD9_9GAMM|nr:SPFH domain-containing protein [Thiohalospira halophila]SFD22944.1 Regulator of protease activity HflC, stomatin/prohibitin superfamily [Thiohalospira halophila DSM 15071]